MSAALDLGVAIEHVRVRCGARARRPAPPLSIVGYLDDRQGAPLHDHRIVIRELCIDVEAPLDAARARALGTAVARALGDRLAAIQAERQPDIARAPTTGGPIRIDFVCVHLWGEPASHPASRDISAALIAPLEERLRHG